MLILLCVLLLELGCLGGINYLLVITVRVIRLIKV
jgi:hypothetical protein